MNILLGKHFFLVDVINANNDSLKLICHTLTSPINLEKL